jgi:SAM-dependent methyltransferase
MFGPRHEHRLAMIVREVAQLPRGARLLDGAVGLGQLATRLQARGYKVVGIDYAFDAALYAMRNGIPSVVGDLTKMPFRDGAFDGMTTGETLEHLDDDASAAGEIGRVIKDGGRVIATVPALKSLWSASDDYYEHRRRYSRAQLVRLFAERFTIEKAKFWGFPIVLAYDTLFLLPMNKRRARRNVAEDAALQSVARAGRARGLVTFVRAVFSVDRLFEWIPFGPGLLLVARRRGD